MKVSFQYGLAGFTGKMDGLVFCYNRYLGKVYARKRVYPTLTAHHEKFGSVNANLFAIQPSQGYKDNMYVYMKRYATLKGPKTMMLTWSNLYMKLMYDMAKADATIDLRTLTREEIYLRDLPCISVQKAVLAGLLPRVYDWQSFVHEL
ncbi:hypothetical protein MASR2M64_11640 [Candidatus Cloacimonadota bacterium]|nr:hypothetical protein [Candidatus Cloacimonadota bacterium]